MNCESWQRSAAGIVVKEYTDHGISGGKGREARPGLNSMLKAADAGEFQVILVWATDRLGRSLINLIHTLQDLDVSQCRTVHPHAKS